jgi:hypothetical protein
MFKNILKRLKGLVTYDELLRFSEEITRLPLDDWDEYPVLKRAPPQNSWVSGCSAGRLKSLFCDS